MLQNGRYRILCFGESTTAGHYPSHLEQILNEKMPQMKFSVIDKGVPGINSTIILSRLNDFINKYKPQIVIVMMGINDGEDMVAYSETHTIQNDKLRVWKTIKVLASRIHDILKKERPRVFMNRSSNWYVEQSEFCKSSGEFEKARQLLEEALRKNPQNDMALFELAIYYVSHKKNSEAENILRKYLEINPDNDLALFELGRCMLRQQKYEEVEQIFKQIMKLNTHNVQAYVELIMYYEENGRYAEAKELLTRLKSELKKIKSLQGGNLKRYRALCGYYINTRRYVELKGFLIDIVSENPNPEFLIVLIECCEKLGDNKLADEYSQLLHTRGGYYKPATRSNYQKLVELVTQKSIKLVCMEYPLRNSAILRETVGNKEGVIVISNEEIFTDAVKYAEYREYFTDSFAGIFGHCTAKGDRLLAQNLAEIIIKKEAFPTL